MASETALAELLLQIQSLSKSYQANADSKRLNEEIDNDRRTVDSV